MDIHDLRYPVEFHEAGHASVALALGLKVSHVEILPMDGTTHLGEARVPLGSIPPDKAFRLAVFALGGMMYENMCVEGCRGQPGVTLRAREAAISVNDEKSDDGNFYLFAACVHGPAEIDRYLERYEQFTNSVLARNQLATSAVKDVLLAALKAGRPHVSGGEIEKAWIDAGGTPAELPDWSQETNGGARI